MRRAFLMLALLALALWPAPSLAQSRNQLGPLCTTDTTPAAQMIEACNKIDLTVSKVSLQWPIGIPSASLW